MGIEATVTKNAGARARVRRLALLLLLSCSIGGAFYVLDRMDSSLMDRTGGALSSVGTQDLDLAVRPSERPASVSPDSWAQSKLVAYRLGRMFGRACGFESLPTGGKYAAEQMATVAKLLGVLSIPPPSLFRSQHRANFLIEFNASLETDPAGTARALAQKYSPAHAELFRLGAVLGVQDVYAAALDLWAPVNRREVMMYARRADLPEELWGVLTHDLESPLVTQQRNRTRNEVMASIEKQIVSGSLQN